MKATEQHFPVEQSVVLYKLILTFESMDVSESVIIQMKAPEKYVPVGSVCYSIQGDSNV